MDPILDTSANRLQTHYKHAKLTYLNSASNYPIPFVFFQEVKLAAMRKDDLPSKNLDPYQKVYLASGTVNHLEEESNKKGKRSWC